MDWFKAARDWLLPDTEDILTRGQAGLVIASCLGLATAFVCLVLTWLASGDLQSETVMGGAVFILLLVGIGALARAGRASLAAGLLVILLALSIMTAVATYGVASMTAAAYVIPVVLAACSLGLWAGLGVAGVGSGLVWLLAWAETVGWYAPLLRPDISHLTFNAPALTAVFLLTALIVGAWTRYLTSIMRRSR